MSTCPVFIAYLEQVTASARLGASVLCPSPCNHVGGDPAATMYRGAHENLSNIPASLGRSAMLHHGRLARH